jgi:acetyl-CoA carboxylase biotin carboxyl carrier protein
MELKLIESLVRIMQRGEISDLEVDDAKAGLRLRIQRGPKTPSSSAPVVHVTQAGGVPAPLAAPVAVAAGHAPAEPAAPSGPPPGTEPFKSPMVGTFYRSASPEAEPFVGVGTTVKPETTICIIEAMKVMNEIKAETSGQIVEILVENGEPIEFGQPLFLIKKS